MTREQVYVLWAPSGAIWSRWVKPVVFASLPRTMVEPMENIATHVSATWAPVEDERTALVLDLPGTEGVAIGLSLAEMGYQPIALYNAHPGPGSVFSMEPRCCSYWGGSCRASPRCSGDSSVAKPGLSVAISNRIPDGSRK